MMNKKVILIGIVLLNKLPKNNVWPIQGVKNTMKLMLLMLIWKIMLVVKNK